MRYQKYTPESMHQLNDAVYSRGIPISVKNPYDITSETELNNLERRLERYSAKFGEPAVLGEWGQPFGGPSDGFRIHKACDVQELQKAYAAVNANGIYPKLGSIIDAAWIAKKRDYLKLKPQEFDLDLFFEKVSAGRI